MAFEWMTSAERDRDYRTRADRTYAAMLDAQARLDQRDRMRDPATLDASELRGKDERNYAT